MTTALSPLAPEFARERRPAACERARLALAARWAEEPLAPSLLRDAASHLEECAVCRQLGDRLAEARWDGRVSTRNHRVIA